MKEGENPPPCCEFLSLTNILVAIMSGAKILVWSLFPDIFEHRKKLSPYHMIGRWCDPLQRFFLPRLRSITFLVRLLIRLPHVFLGFFLVSFRSAPSSPTPTHPWAEAAAPHRCPPPLSSSPSTSSISPTINPSKHSILNSKAATTVTRWNASTTTYHCLHGGDAAVPLNPCFRPE
jgi:hypothetical protein